MTHSPDYIAGLQAAYDACVERRRRHLKGLPEWQREEDKDNCRRLAREALWCADAIKAMINVAEVAIDQEDRPGRVSGAAA